jgi:hypothetical protein
MMEHQSTFWPEEHRAKVSALPDCERDSATLAADSCLRLLKSLNVTGLGGLSGKTCPACCHQTEEGILVPLSGRWGTWGMGGPTESWTLNGSEFHKGAAACSLSDVLEASEVHQRYFLTPKACLGIIRRADRRGKALPTILRLALEQVAAGFREQEKPEGKTH